MKKGSITVFSALCMSFVFSALFVLLEAARFYGLSQYADWKGRQGVECVAAENLGMWCPRSDWPGSE